MLLTTKRKTDNTLLSFIFFFFPSFFFSFALVVEKGMCMYVVIFFSSLHRCSFSFFFIQPVFKKREESSDAFSCFFFSFKITHTRHVNIKQAAFYSFLLFSFLSFP